jgi:hypothetical protein
MQDLLPNGEQKPPMDQLLMLFNETKAKVKKGQNAQALEMLKKLKALLSKL